MEQPFRIFGAIPSLSGRLSANKIIPLGVLLTWQLFNCKSVFIVDIPKILSFRRLAKEEFLSLSRFLVIGFIINEHFQIGCSL